MSKVVMTSTRVRCGMQGLLRSASPGGRPVEVRMIEAAYARVDPYCDQVASPPQRVFYPPRLTKLIAAIKLMQKAAP